MRDWIAIHHSSAIQRTTPVRATVWGRHYVVFRDLNGDVHVLDDRCAHRGAPLSCGKVDGDGVRCPYHGWKYDGDGRCIDVPSVDDNKRLPKAQVVSYPVVEQQGMIWCYPHQESEPAFALPPRLAILDASGWHRTTFSYDFGAPWQWLMENMCDGSHVPFAHAASVGRGRKHSYEIDGLETYERSDGRVGIRAHSVLNLRSYPLVRSLAGAANATWLGLLTGARGIHVDIEITWPTSLNVTIALGSDTSVSLTTFFIPETPTRTRMDLVIGRTVASARPVNWIARRVVRRILDEDHKIANWSEEIGWTTTSGERSTPADGPALAFRKLLRVHAQSVPFALDDLGKPQSPIADGARSCS